MDKIVKIPLMMAHFDLTPLTIIITIFSVLVERYIPT